MLKYTELKTGFNDNGPAWIARECREPMKSMLKAFARACRQAGCPGRIPHDLRRTAVRNLERAGVPRSVAMKLTGHLTESVYRRYAIASEADMNTAGQQLAALFTSVFTSTEGVGNS